MTSDDAQPKPLWLQTIQTIGAVAIPVVIALVGHLYTKVLKERDAQLRFVELALTILQQPPEKASLNLRIWATQVVDHYSGVELPKEAAADLQTTVPLPSSIPGPVSSGMPRGGDSLMAVIRLSYPADVSWWHHQSPNRVHTVDRVVGPGVDSFPLDQGGTMHFKITNRVTHETITRDNIDCTKGVCNVP